MRRKSTLAITLAAAMAATAVPAMADDKVSITIFNSKMEVQSQFEEMAEKYAEDNGINIEVYYSNDTVAAHLATKYSSGDPRKNAFRCISGQPGIFYPELISLWYYFRCFPFPFF